MALTPFYIHKYFVMRWWFVTKCRGDLSPLKLCSNWIKIYLSKGWEESVITCLGITCPWGLCRVITRYRDEP